TVSPHGESESDPEAAIPTVEVPSVSEDMGIVETDSDAALVEVGSDESMETEAFELMDESGTGETDAAAEVAPVKGGKSQRGSRRGAGPMGASARMRALEIEAARSHTGWTFTLLVGVVLLSVHMGVIQNLMMDVQPEWVTNFTGYFRGVVDSMYTWF